MGYAFNELQDDLESHPSYNAEAEKQKIDDIINDLIADSDASSLK